MRMRILQIRVLLTLSALMGIAYGQYHIEEFQNYPELNNMDTVEKFCNAKKTVPESAFYRYCNFNPENSKKLEKLYQNISLQKLYSSDMCRVYELKKTRPELAKLLTKLELRTISLGLQDRKEGLEMCALISNDPLVDELIEFLSSELVERRRAVESLASILIKSRRKNEVEPVLKYNDSLINKLIEWLSPELVEWLFPEVAFKKRELESILKSRGKNKVEPALESSDPSVDRLANWMLRQIRPEKFPLDILIYLIIETSRLNDSANYLIDYAIQYADFTSPVNDSGYVSVVTLAILFDHEYALEKILVAASDDAKKYSKGNLGYINSMIECAIVNRAKPKIIELLIEYSELTEVPGDLIEVAEAFYPESIEVIKNAFNAKVKASETRNNQKDEL